MYIGQSYVETTLPTICAIGIHDDRVKYTQLNNT